jgi:hypothetical protein
MSNRFQSVILHKMVRLARVSVGGLCFNGSFKIDKTSCAGPLSALYVGMWGNILNYNNNNNNIVSSLPSSWHSIVSCCLVTGNCHQHTRRSRGQAYSSIVGATDQCFFPLDFWGMLNGNEMLIRLDSLCCICLVVHTDLHCMNQEHL